MVSSHEDDHVWGSVASKGLKTPGLKGDYITRILFPALVRQLLRKTPLCEYRAFEQCDTLRRHCATDRRSDFPRIATNSVSPCTGCVLCKFSRL